MNTRERRSPKRKLRGGHQIYSNRSPETISTICFYKNQVTKVLNGGKLHNNCKVQPVMTINNNSAYYIRT